MTREELKRHCQKQIEGCEMWAIYKGEEPHGKVYEEHKLILELLEQEPTTKNDLAVDCISRQAVIDEMEKRHTEGDCITKGFIKNMPSVTPIRPKGHWICDGKGRSFADYHCSECGLKLALCGQDIKQRQDSGYSLFCGGCGADMREVEE